MSTFHDVGHYAERRKADLERRRRKKIMVALSSAGILILAVVAAAVAFASVKGGGNSNSNGKSKSSHGTPAHSSSSKSSSSSSSSSGGAESTISTSSKYLDVLCSATDYKSTCETTLSKAVGKDDSEDPKKVLKAVIGVVLDEVSKAFENGTGMDSSDPQVKGAIEDCVDLYVSSKDEITRTMDSVVDVDVDSLSKRSNDLQTWLSAVMAFQQTCIDGFPDGDLKTKMNDVMKTAKQSTSNALAIIGQTSKVSVQSPASNRRLLSADSPAGSDLGEDGLPIWLDDDDRRLLKEKATDSLTPNVTVAQDGSGAFTTINAALAAMPAKYDGRYVIYVKQGVYDEKVNITKQMVNVTMYGEGSRKTIITGSKNVIDGERTLNTAPFVVYGHGFTAMLLGFRNTAGAEKHQAVALRVLSDRSVFINCRMEGNQDTLYAHAQRQFYRGCVIAGTIDFIFGDATAIFQNCVLLVLRPMDNQQTIITAQGRSDAQETTGFVLHNCKIQPDGNLTDAAKPAVSSYLARPWKEYSRTVIMESNIDGFINPEGYTPWEGDFALETLYYAEYKNTGAGADTAKRVKWPGVHVIEKEEAQKYTVSSFIDGSNWLVDRTSQVRLSFYS